LLKLDDDKTEMIKELIKKRRIVARPGGTVKMRLDLEC
jgi:hypothetical protein